MGVKYNRVLQALVKKLEQETKTTLLPVLVATEPQYVHDAFAAQLQAAITRLRLQFLNVGRLAREIASAFVLGTNRANRQRFYSAVEQAIGVNLAGVVAEEGLEDTLVAATSRNVNLIKSIPEQYFDQIEQIVMTQTLQGQTARSITEEIRDVGNTTESRAKLIARDQTSKLNGDLNKVRQENLGVEEYVWETSDDERVRQSHKDNDGKTFRWDTPPPETGHPGHDIQCRCVARPVVKL